MNEIAARQSYFRKEERRSYAVTSPRLRRTISNVKRRRVGKYTFSVNVGRPTFWNRSPCSSMLMSDPMNAATACSNARIRSSGIKVALTILRARVLWIPSDLRDFFTAENNRYSTSKFLSRFRVTAYAPSCRAITRDVNLT